MADFISREDLDFLLYDWLNATELLERPRFAEHSKETFDGVLDLSYDMAAKLYAPFNKKGDQIEPKIGADGKVELIPETAAAVNAFGEAGLVAASFDEELGGMALPQTISRATMFEFMAANNGFACYPMLTVGNANLLVEYGSPEQIETWVKPMLEGRYTGTMCLSEPQAGSSLADITTRAVPADAGNEVTGANLVGDRTYRITGTKMWISGGDHEIADNIVHLVLAKTPGGAPGVKGISLFIVPKVLPDGTRNDVALVGLNHKMGNRATTNCLLNLGDGTFGVGDGSGAVGYLVGDEHQGLKYMFNMMNEARIGVGFMATGQGVRGYLDSVEYAKVRTQGRPVDSKDPSSKPIALIEHPDVRRLLLAQKSYAEGALALCLYASNLVDREKTATDEAEATRVHTLLEVLTPIVKSWPSQWCLEGDNMAIQVHGGYGYTKEFDVEQYYRDNRLNPIHEGAKAIHGLDLLGRKVVMNGGQGFTVLADAIGATIAKAQTAGGETAEFAAALGASLGRLGEVTMALWAPGDPALALANATVYLEAAGHVVVAWLWLEQLLAVGDRDGDFFDGKRAAARYFYRYELPKTGPQLDLLAGLDRTTLDADPAWF
ncbi:MAG: acyl-CoA dehydrogenase [Gordonia sp. (in: high G+C Gram-positive bacteria)]|uniref:acyl-CoA dehydrogenase n=1 Tax=Gordonia sp. (in: high G+C Gram-positive bacteria) TaxID=84139 RepID=UPI0039E50391